MKNGITITSWLRKSGGCESRRVDEATKAELTRLMSVAEGRRSQSRAPKDDVSHDDVSQY
jgi:hypothetical protein